jgi:hypothetical protein
LTSELHLLLLLLQSVHPTLSPVLPPGLDRHQPLSLLLLLCLQLDSLLSLLLSLQPHFLLLLLSLLLLCLQPLFLLLLLCLQLVSLLPLLVLPLLLPLRP